MKAILLILVVCFCLPGCIHMFAIEMVEAPNIHAPDSDKSDVSDEELHKLLVDRQIRVPVGPPDATLSVWITDPNHDSDHVTITGQKDGSIKATITRQPATMPAPKPTHPVNTLIFLHGFQDNKDFAPHALYRDAFIHDDYRVIQIDLRGHGRSTGEWITWGAVESHDLVQVLDELQRQHLIIGRVGVIGFSYGAAIALQWAAIDPRIEAIVAIEPFASLFDVAHDAAGFVLGPWRFLYSDDDVQNTLIEAGQLAGFDPASISPITSITKTKAPVLLIHSRDDTFIPFSHSERLHAAAPDHSNLIVVSKSTHFDIWATAFNTIRPASLAWFSVKLKAPGDATTKPATTLPATSAAP